MPPDRLDTESTMSRPRSRREPSPLEQIPVWDGFVADAPATSVDGDPPAGLDALLGGLNPEQLRAVTHGDGPLLVVAGAGTGKTQVITRRIAWLIATRRARPSEILALTFTDKAAEEMQARVDQLVPYGYTDAAIGTFHAFGDRVIREYALELGLPTDVRVLTRPEVVIFLREHLFEFDLDEYRPLGDPTRFLGALATLFSRCKDEDVVAGGVPRPRRRSSRRCAVRGPDAGRRGDSAEDAPAPAASSPGPTPATRSCSARPGSSTSATRSPRAPARARRRPAARAELQSRFRYILVDEFQDTNRAQSELVVAPRRAASQRHGRRRRRPVDLQVPRRGDQQHPRLPGALPVGADRRPAAQLPLARADPRRVPTGWSGFNDPDRLEVRAGISKQLRAERVGGRAQPPVRRRGVRDRTARRRTGSPPRSAAGSRPARGRATTPSSSGPTADADPILRSLNVAGHPVAVLRHVRAVRPAGGPACCSRSCGPSRTRSSSVDVYALAAAEPYGLGGEDLDRDRQHRPDAATGASGRSSRSSTGSRASCASRTGDARGGEPARRATSGATRELAHERPAGEVLYAFLRDAGSLARLAASDSRGRRGGAPATSPASSTSSAASRRCSPTTGRSSWRATSRRSSRPATTRRPRTSIRTPTPSRS